MRRDLDRRAEVLGESLARNVERDLERDAQRTLQKTVQQFANREHLAGLAVYDPQGNPIAVTTNLQPLMDSAPPIVLNRSRKITIQRHSFGWGSLPSTFTLSRCTTAINWWELGHRA